MDNEIHIIQKNEVIDLLANKKLIRVKWVYKAKYNHKVEIDCFKGRSIAKGYKQKPMPLGRFKHSDVQFRNIGELVTKKEV